VRLAGPPIFIHCPRTRTRRGEPVSLFAFLRWKLDDGALSLGVALHRAEHVRQDVFKAIVDDAAARTERPAVFGRLV